MSEADGFLATPTSKDGAPANSPAAATAATSAATAQRCEHAVVFAGLCADCGKEVPAEDGNHDTGDGQHAQSHRRPGLVTSRLELRVAPTALRKVEQDSRRELINAKRLVLVLDIDHTLLVTRHAGLGERPRNGAVLMRLGRQGSFHVRLRPGLQRFLERAKSLFRMYLYTQGTVKYAEAVVKLMDPAATFFGAPPRLFARETTPQGLKSLAEIFPSDASLVVVVDDRDEVWPPAVRNSQIVKVSPYLAWEGDSRRGISLEGEIAKCQPKHEDAAKLEGSAAPVAPAAEASSEAAAPSPNGDGQLEALWATLVAIHDEAFRRKMMTEEHGAVEHLTEEATNIEPSVPRALLAIRQAALRDCVVCLSGVLPAGADLQRHAVAWWLRALGAKVEQNLGPNTTHLVTARRNTEKYHSALRHRSPLFIVHPGWVLQAVASWKHPDESMFTVPRDGDWPCFLALRLRVPHLPQQQPQPPPLQLQQQQQQQQQKERQGQLTEQCDLKEASAKVVQRNNLPAPGSSPQVCSKDNQQNAGEEAAAQSEETVAAAKRARKLHTHDRCNLANSSAAAEAASSDPQLHEQQRCEAHCSATITNISPGGESGQRDVDSDGDVEMLSAMD